MAYKKYIKRGGKVYGPYIYHSKRVGGKVVSEYHGTPHKKIDYKKFLWVGLGVLIVGLLVFGVSFLGNRISGQATFDVKVDYKEGEALDGVLKLSLKEGELLPTSSKLVFENNGERYEYILGEILSDKITEGDFYVEGKEVVGSGEGYGKEGDKEVYSTVYFTLEIYENQDTTEEVEETPSQNLDEESVEEEPEELEEEIVEEPEESEESVEEEPEETTEESIEEAIEEPGITGGAVSFFFGWMGTGRVVMELKTEIEGQVSVDNPFTYTLAEGETVEIKSKSVRTSLEELNDNVIDLDVNGDEVIVTTDYSEKGKGFGEDYLREDTKTLNIDLSDLNLMLGEGDLKISLIYSEEELISLTTILQEGETSETQVKEGKEIVEEVVEEALEQEIIVIGSGIDLTEEERAILINEFGTRNINTIREEVYNGRLIIGSQLKDYKIEHSYEYPQNADDLKVQIEADRGRWLKDIAATLSRKASASQQVDIIEDSYLL